jgi:PEP-CTERM motif
MKSVFIAIIFLNVGLCGVRGAAILPNTGGARGHQFLLSDGATRVLATATDPTTVFKIGYLAIAGDSSTFQPFAQSSVSHPQAPYQVGGFFGQVSDNNTSGVGGISVIADKKLVLWVFAQSGQQGMFTSAEWTVPANFGSEVESSFEMRLGATPSGGTPPVVTIVSLPGFSAASYAAPVSITLGTFTATNSSSYVLGSPIPEPSAMGLIGLCATWVLRRKRSAGACRPD